jgi:uncharacterized protein YegL
MKNLKKRIVAWFLLMLYMLGNPTTMVFADIIGDINQDANGTVAVPSVKVGIDKNGQYTDRIEENELQQGDLVVTKSVTPTNNVGEYTVSFSLIGKDVTETTTHPIYTVVVFDISNSMKSEHMHEAKKGLVKYEEELGICDKIANPTAEDLEREVCTGSGTSANKIAFVTFYEKAQAKRSTFSSDPINANELPSNNTISNSGTRYLRGLQAASKIIMDAKNPEITPNEADRIPDNAEVVILFLSDGLPGDATYLFNESIK